MQKKINISDFKNLYFIGIGGIGMSALARYFSGNGKNVAGYDKITSVITDTLAKININIHFTDEVATIPKQYLDSENTLIIYTPAIPETHAQLNYFKEKEFTILKRAAILGLITKETFCFAVAGTHGKTTTSTILGHVLKEAGVDATSFLGGIASNYNSNLILGGDEISVVEADEYDRSFLELSPNIACITSTDADHLDIYGKANALEKAFVDFANIVSDTLFIRYGIPIKGITFGLEDQADYQAKNSRFENGNSIFDIKTPTESYKNLRIQLPGNHNILNALAVIAMANHYGVSIEKIKKGLASFIGIERRFNIKINTKELVLIDDYAHHPTEINAVYETIEKLYPQKEKIVLFQPHLYSRTKDFANDFATSLAQFDAVLLLDIYPARELPIKGITSAWLLEKIKEKNQNAKLIAKDTLEIIKHINKENVVVSMLGAGDIGVLISEVCKEINAKELIE